jgi:hypothetical protein
MPTIVEYTDTKTALNQYPHRIISPPHAGPCCFSDTEEKGYCVLAESPGWVTIPSIEEYRESCTTLQWGDCSWFRSNSHEWT